MSRKATGTAFEKDGHLYFQVTPPGGKRRTRPCPERIKTLAQAKEYATWFSEQLRLGNVQIEVPPEPPADPADTFKAWSERWLAHRKTRGLTGYKDDESRLRVHIWPTLGQVPIAAVTTEDLERFVVDLDAKIQAGAVSWKTARNIWGLVSKAFADARKSKDPALRVRKDNPAVDVAPPDEGTSKSKVYLWPSEFERLLRCDRVPVRWKRLVALSVYLYCRAGELEALRWEDLDLPHGVIHVHRSIDRYRDIGQIKPTKGQEARRYPIEPALLPLLWLMREEAGGDEATGMIVKMPPAEDLAARLRQYLDWAGVKREELHVDASDKTRRRITWHDLRATGITWRAVRGDEPLRIQSAAGHKDFATTQVYIREAESLRAGFGEPFPALDLGALAIAYGNRLPDAESST